MHFGFALDLSGKDLWNIDLLDTQDVLEDKNLLHWGCIEYIFKTCLQDIFKSNKCLFGNF